MSNIKRQTVIFLIMLFSTQVVLGQSEIRRKASDRPSGEIDTLFLFPPRTYISIKKFNGEEFFHSDQLSASTVDSIYLAVEPYFRDTSTFVGTRNHPKISRTIIRNSFTTEQTKQYLDTLESFFLELKEHTNITDIYVPNLFFDQMENNDATFALIIFEYGFIKSDQLYKRQVIETVMLNILLRGTNIPVSKHHSEVSCCVLDLKNHNIAFYGQVSVNKLPVSAATIEEQLHWIFDPYFVKRRFTN